MSSKEALKKMRLYDTLVNELITALELSVVEGGIMNNGVIMEWHDLESVSLFNPIPYENDRIDGVLLFGDGTIEFHLENDGDALNWTEFSNDYIKMIIQELQEKQCSKFV